MAVGVCSSVSFSAKKFLRGVSSNMERGPAYSYLVPIDVDHPQAACGNDEQAANEAMMPPCHTSEETYGKKDDVLLVVQKEGKDRFHCQAHTFLRFGERKEAPASVDGAGRPGPLTQSPVVEEGAPRLPVG